MLRLDKHLIFWSPRARRWALRTLIFAAGLTISWALLDVPFGMQTGLRYAVYQPGEEFVEPPHAEGFVALPSLRGEGVSADDEIRLTRGAGRRTVRWSGRWYVPDSGTYEIFASGTGDLTVQIGRDQVVHHRGTSDDAVSGLVELDEGFHRFRVTFRRSDLQPRMTVHWAPAGQSPRPFDRYSLVPMSADEKHYDRFRVLLLLRRLSLVAWAVALTLLLGPPAIAAVARLPAATVRLGATLRACSDRVTVGAVSGSAAFVAATLFQLELGSNLGAERSAFLSLLDERNLAAWWSGALLLMAALYAVEAASQGSEPLLTGARSAAARTDHWRARVGWGCFAIILAALSADEIGEFHEFMDEILGWGTWWSLLPFALALLGIAGAGVLALWSTPEYRRTALAMMAGFAVLGTIPPLLEFAEHDRNWGIATNWSHPYILRAVLEEGSELVGVLIVLHACAWGGLKMRRACGVSTSKSGRPDVMALRRPLLVAGWPLAVGVAMAAPSLPAAMSPERWFVTAFFLVAAVTSFSRLPATAGSRAIGVIGLVGSIAGTVSRGIMSPVWLFLSTALLLTWWYTRMRRPQAPGW